MLYDELNNTLLTLMAIAYIFALILNSFYRFENGMCLFERQNIIDIGRELCQSDQMNLGLKVADTFFNALFHTKVTAFFLESEKFFYIVLG